MRNHAVALLPVNTPRNKAESSTKQGYSRQVNQKTFFGTPDRGDEEICIPNDEYAHQQKADANEQILFKNFCRHNWDFLQCTASVQLPDAFAGRQVKRTDGRIPVRGFYVDSKPFCDRLQLKPQNRF
ncbi:hypothetical protein [Flavisolibacter nicotianae]|uniref:hypothetical protein n=1 Tax=Flavisolibacter nicotianae TaxID=2364882 RepID=UPI0013C41C64|nr:hypothetical protein [Flavisolibacter nicotianae]